MKKHPLVGAQFTGLGLVVVVEDLLVDLCSRGVFVGILVLDGSEFEICVSVT